jgi:intein-encoded DNA endonuclease-like protein
LLGNYIAGFVDGEGSFNISLKKRNDYKQHWKITASFNVSQRDKTTLSKMKSKLKCGTLRKRKDGVIYYEVTDIDSLFGIIIPFFRRFKFISALKKKNFSIFSRIVFLLKSGEHANPQGLHKILVLRESLNKGRGRKRKYSIRDVYTAGTSETTRETVSNR